MLILAVQQYAISPQCIVTDEAGLSQLIYNNICGTIHIGESFSYAAAAYPPLAFEGTLAGNYFGISATQTTEFIQEVYSSTVKNLLLNIEYTEPNIAHLYAFNEVSSSVFSNCLINQVGYVPVGSLALIYEATLSQFINCEFKLEIGDINATVYHLAMESSNIRIENCSFDTTTTDFCTLATAAVAGKEYCRLYAITGIAPLTMDSVSVNINAEGVYGYFHIFTSVPTASYHFKNIKVSANINGYQDVAFYGLILAPEGNMQFSNISVDIFVDAASINSFYGLAGALGAGVQQNMVLRDVYFEFQKPNPSAGNYSSFMSALPLSTLLSLRNVTLDLIVESVKVTYTPFYSLSTTRVDLNNYTVMIDITGTFSGEIYAFAYSLIGASDKSTTLFNVTIIVSGSGSATGEVSFAYNVEYVFFSNLTIDAALDGDMFNVMLFGVSSYNKYKEVHYYIEANNIKETSSTYTSDYDIYNDYAVHLVLTNPVNPSFYGIASALTNAKIDGFYFNSSTGLAGIYAVAYAFTGSIANAPNVAYSIENAYSVMTLAHIATNIAFRTLQVNPEKVDLNGHLSGVVEICNTCIFKGVISKFAVEHTFTGSILERSYDFSAICGVCKNVLFTRIQVSFSCIFETKAGFTPEHIGGVCAHCFNFSIRTAEVNATVRISPYKASSDQYYKYTGALVGNASNNSILLHDIYYRLEVPFNTTSCNSMIGIYDNRQLITYAGIGTVFVDFEYIIDYSVAKCNQLPLIITPNDEDGFPLSLINVKYFICANTRNDKPCNVNTTKTELDSLTSVQNMEYFVLGMLSNCEEDEILLAHCNCHGNTVV